MLINYIIIIITAMLFHTFLFIDVTLKKYYLKIVEFHLSENVSEYVAELKKGHYCFLLTFTQTATHVVVFLIFPEGIFPRDQLSYI